MPTARSPPRRARLWLLALCLQALAAADDDDNAPAPAEASPALLAAAGREVTFEGCVAAELPPWLAGVREVEVLAGAGPHISAPRRTERLVALAGSPRSPVRAAALEALVVHHARKQLGVAVRLDVLEQALLAE